MQRIGSVRHGHMLKSESIYPPSELFMEQRPRFISLAESWQFKGSLSRRRKVGALALFERE